MIVGSPLEAADSGFQNVAMMLRGDAAAMNVLTTWTIWSD
jgi:hypothetical protein